jgi:predicted GH43/DUF377 family glycosyl hydrolase
VHEPVTAPVVSADAVMATSVHLRPDPSRVYAALFMPGEEQSGDHSRATSVINRVLALDDADVSEALADLHLRFADRRSLDETFQLNFDTISPRLGAQALPPADRQLLIGSYFTHDVSPEGAALTNPSIVAHPDQSGVEPGALRFILSARAIGEGHVSSIEFRTGLISSDGRVCLDVAGPRFETARQDTPTYQRPTFWAQLVELGFAGDIAHLVLDDLGDTFDRPTLEEAIARRDGQIRARRASRETMSWLRWIADNNYKVTFREGSDISDRLLGPTESNGLEDARMVRFVGDDGAATYYATYTAYDGHHVSPQLLRTDDFRTFTAHQLAGPAAKNKGMALFPRLIGGRHACLSRWDRERSFVAWSDDGVTWDSATPIQEPSRTWDLIQLGNCGSPLETPEGWLVLTHGVGPMRTYSIGAMLLRLDDPTQVIASLTTPLVTPVGEERNGYVPNVVYTCGGLIHGEHLILPYGFGDQAITVSVIELPDLLRRLTDPASSSRG